MIKLDQEIGKRYGRLVVIEKTDKRYHSTTIYKCRCDCGNIVELTINKLHSGHTKSCGCLKRRTVDLTGQKSGRLTVIGFAYTKKQKELLGVQMRLWKYLFCTDHLLNYRSYGFLWMQE